MRDAIAALAPVLADALIKSEGRKPPRNPQDKVDAAPAVFHQAINASLAVANDPAMAQMQLVGGLGDVARPFSVGWRTLKWMRRTPLIAAVVKVLKDQVSEFTRPSDSAYQPGFMVRLRDRRQSGSRAAAQMCRNLESLIANCGMIRDPREFTTRQTFTALVSSAFDDSLTYDQMCIEVVNGSRRFGQSASYPELFKAVDASTIRLSADALMPYGLPADDFTTPRYVQVVDGQPVAQFDSTQMIFGVRNPSSDIYGCGYGTSELEYLVRILTAWLNAFARNDTYFKQGFTGRGFLIDRNNEYPMTEQQRTALVSEMRELMVGVQGSHRLGFLQGDLEFLNVGNDTQDQQWGNWSDLQVKLVCAMYGVEPASINHLFGNQGQASSMNSGDQAAREDSTRQRGLVPKVRWLFERLDRHIVCQIDPDFELVPTGIRTDEATDLDEDVKRLAFYTLNEVRARHDLPARPDGDIIGSTIGVQSAQMVEARESQPDEAAEPLDLGALFAGAEADDRPDEVEDAGQAPREDAPLQASRRGATMSRRLYWEE